MRRNKVVVYRIVKADVHTSIILLFQLKVYEGYSNSGILTSDTYDIFDQSPKPVACLEISFV
jgi:hypothetical protein